MSQKIVVLDGHTLTPAKPGRDAPAGEPTWGRIAALGDLTVHDRTPDDAVLQHIGDATVALTNKTPITADTLAKAPHLQYVGVLATGVNVVDLAAAKRHGVTVCNAPGYSSESVAQHVFALLLELVSQIGRHNEAVHRGLWSSCKDFCFTLAPTTELVGKTLGIVGLGDIGRRVAMIGHALGMPIAAAHQSSMHRVSIPGIDVRWLPHDELFAAADVVTLHCPLTDQTRRMINKPRLDSMKRGGYLINTGRGALLDEDEVARALADGRLAGAGLDVLSTEPPSPDNPLLHAPNCVITPHTAWATQAARRRLMGIAADNLQAFLNGNPQNVVS